MLKMRTFAGAVVILFLAAVSSTAQAAVISRAILDFNQTMGPGFAIDNLATDTTTLLFDEIPNQDANGVTVNGVTITFTDAITAPTFAKYNISAGTFGPSLSGSSTGILQFDFGVPTSTLSFDIQMLSFDTAIAVSVQLFDENLNALGSAYQVNSSVLDLFSEGRFEVSLGGEDLPEPSALGLVGLGLAGATMARRRKYRK